MIDDKWEGKKGTPSEADSGFFSFVPDGVRWLLCASGLSPEYVDYYSG